MFTGFSRDAENVSTTYVALSWTASWKQICHRTPLCTDRSEQDLAFLFWWNVNSVLLWLFEHIKQTFHSVHLYTLDYYAIHKPARQCRSDSFKKGHKKISTNTKWERKKIQKSHNSPPSQILWWSIVSLEDTYLPYSFQVTNPTVVHCKK